MSDRLSSSAGRVGLMTPQNAFSTLDSLEDDRLSHLGQYSRARTLSGKE